MTQGRQVNFKKSLYLFLSSLLGMLMFLAIHQILTFFFVIWALVSGRLVSFEAYVLFLAFDYLTLVFVLLLGSWYGIWLGIHWFEKVYEEASYGGVIHHLWNRGRQNFGRQDDFATKVKVTERTLQEGVKDFQQLAEEFPPAFIAEKIQKKVALGRRNGRKPAAKK